MMHYLYRKSALRAIATSIAVFLLVTFSAAQQHTRNRQTDQAPTTTPTAKKAKRGPRAIGVVEFLPNGGMRLVPIALWIEGKYYDASEYGANPEPMAIEPQTVYEAQSLGEPTGTFTITTPKQVNGSWVADGTWRPELPMDVKLAAQAAKDAALKAKSASSREVMTSNEDDTRPVLKRAAGSSSDSTNSSQPAAAATTDPDRPTMKRAPADSSSKPTMGPMDGPPASAPASTAKTQTTVDDGDPDRPVMKRKSPAATPAATTSDSDSASAGPAGITPAAAASNDNDPSRPVLSHSKTTKSATASATESASAKTDMAFPTAGKGARAYPAISDAGHYESRPLLYSLTSGERQIQEQQMLKLAMSEIRDFATKRKGPPVPKTAAITDYEVRAFDLEFSSSPTVVLTAKLPIAAAKGQRDLGFTYFVSIVARVDINDQAQKIFVSVTDSNHLDAFPRMELIDAIDADANGRGDLLFRQYSDTGISYGLYRVSPYQIEKIFQGGSSL
jgi:hypothetical protein